MAKPNIDDLIGVVTQGSGKQYFRNLDTYLTELAAALNNSDNKQIFTTSGTFIVPAGVTRIYISGCAAGGGGASYFGCAAGGGESVQLFPIDVTAGETIAVTIGTGGLGSTNILTNYSGSPSGNFAGTAGGNTTVGSYLTLKGGYPGYSVGSSEEYPGAAGGLGATQGSPMSVHIDMRDASHSGYTYYNGGRGGDSLYGVGGAVGCWSVFSDSVKTGGGDGQGYGSGGGGGSIKAGNGYWSCTKGGNGANGYIEISW